MDDIVIRYEAIKISSQQAQAVQGVGDILFNADILFNYIKTGVMPVPDTAN